MLSGFVLALHVSGTRSARRPPAILDCAWRAAHPVYLLGLVADPAFISNPHPFGTSPVMTVMVVVASLALVQAWSLATANAVNGVAWSLSVEAFLYSVFPAIGERIQRRSSRTIVAWATLAWLVAMIAVSLVTFGSPLIVLPRDALIRLNWMLGPEFNPVMRLPEFFVGIVAGCVFLRKTRGWERSRVIWDGELARSWHAGCVRRGYPSPPDAQRAPLAACTSCDRCVGARRADHMRVLGKPCCCAAWGVGLCAYLLHLPIAQAYDRLANAVGLAGRDVGVSRSRCARR